MPFTRRLKAVAVLIPIVMVTACGGDDENAAPAPTGPTQDSGCGFQSGPFSDSVTVAGDFGAEVSADFGLPYRPTSLERTVVMSGGGKQPQVGAAVNATVTVFNGKTGAVINQQSGASTVGDPATPDVLAAGIRCVPMGSRVVSVAPASELFGDEPGPDLGLDPTDGVVVVTDIGTVVKAPKSEDWADAPSVRFQGRKTPALEVPDGTPPTQVQVDVMTAGTGAVVRAGDQVTVNFKALIWGSGKVINDTYGPGKKPLTFGTNDFVPGFTSAVVGQRAGSKLIVAIPPEFGYGAAGNEAGGVSGTDTLIIVIEIEATSTPTPPPGS